VQSRVQTLPDALLPIPASGVFTVSTQTNHSSRSYRLELASDTKLFAAVFELTDDSVKTPEQKNIIRIPLLVAGGQSA
jgi:hypothetical protein